VELEETRREERGGRKGKTSVELIVDLYGAGRNRRSFVERHEETLWLALYLFGLSRVSSSVSQQDESTDRRAAEYGILVRDISEHSGPESFTRFLFNDFPSRRIVAKRDCSRRISHSPKGIALMQDQRNFQTTFCARRAGHERTRAFALLF